MKKLIIINIILLLIIYTMPTNETIPNENITIETEEIIEIIERNINLELTVDSDLRILSNLKAEEYNKILEGTNLYGLGYALEQAEKTYNINGLYLLGLTCLESGYGTSNFAVYRNNLVRMECS